MALRDVGHEVSRSTIRRLLLDQKIRPKANVKRLCPRPHPERDKQFRYLLGVRQRFENLDDPIVSIDAKNKEKLGLFARSGRTWRSKGIETYAHDFPQKNTIKATPYGVYDVRKNEGYVCVGISGNTAEFAVDSLRRWWVCVGKTRYGKAKRLLLLADGGGSNGYRTRCWKTHLQRFADESGLVITVCHYPTGASKWNPIEHRLFSQISNTMAGNPPKDVEELLHAVRSTKTESGLRVQACLLDKTYPIRLRASKADWDALNIKYHRTCRKWNYSISPHKNGNLFLYAS